MRVLEVIGSLDRGGAETFLVNVFSNINRNKYKFDFLVFQNKKYDYEDTIKKNGGNIIYIESPKNIGIIKFIKKLKNICIKNKYDVVHAHTLFNCGPCMFAAYLAGVKKRISHSHNTRYTEKNISFKKKIYYFISKIMINIFSTDYVACGKEAGNFLYYKNKKVVVVKNGIKIEKFIFDSNKRKELREKLKISENEIVIGHVGRLNFQKNHKYLIDVFNKLCKENDNYKLVLVGDGELKSYIDSELIKNKLENKVIMTGSIENVNEFYNVFDIFVFPSLFEGLPYTLIEAQCNGLPIISSDKVSRECNISKKIVFLDLNPNVSEWIRIINKENSKRYNAIDDVINNGYSIDDTIKIIEKIYNN